MKKIGRTLLVSLMTLLFISTGCDQQSKKTEFTKTRANVLEAGEPESVGMSSDRLARIDNVVSQYLDKKWIPGAVCIIARHGKIIYHKGFGYRDIEASDTMQIDDIFRIASMTKAITSVAVMMLYEEGHFLLDEPISKYIPAFSNPVILKEVNEEDSTFTSYPAKKEITIRELLNHTSGIGYGVFNKNLRILYGKAGIPDGGIVKTNATLEESVKALAKMPLLHEPGEKYLYGLNTDVLGYFIEVISGQKLDDFFADRIFEPIGMTDICFSIPDDKTDRFATLYEDTKDYDLRKSENEQYNYALESNISYLSGGGGLCSTALDYAKFLQMLINGGKYNGTQFLSRKTIDLIRSNQVGDLWGDGAFGLGFGLTTKKNTAKILSSEGSYWWSGYFNTSYWIDPSEDLIAVFMTQMRPFEHWDIHKKFQVLTYQAIAD
ncbi:MAG: serine hydrolase domain-containing protein [Bacteroidota bacterium]